jgi:hypothetical protein
MGYIKGEDGVEGVTKGTARPVHVGARQETILNLRLRTANFVSIHLSSLSSTLYSPQHLFALPGATLTRLST